MDPRLLAIPAAFGLAGASGLNASIPLIVVGLLARVGLVHLATPFDALESDPALFGLACLAVVEFAADKVPALDSVGHLLMAPVAAASGAIVFGSQTGAIQQVDPGLTIVVGLVAGGGTATAVHVTRAAVRPVANLALLGPVVSLLEDTASGLLATAALLAPVALPLLAAAIVLVVWAVRRRRARRREAWERWRAWQSWQAMQASQAPPRWPAPQLVAAPPPVRPWRR